MMEEPLRTVPVSSWAEAVCLSSRGMYVNGGFDPQGRLRHATLPTLPLFDLLITTRSASVK
jgi:hypothetical protein